MKKNICLLLIAALMCSCAGQDNGKDDFITISIDPEDSQIVSIADFFEKIAIVPLETNDTILINAVYNIIPLNKRLYILDRRSSSVFIFSDHGEAKAVIHDQGDGPNKYTNASSIAVNVEKKELYVMDNQLKKKFVYDLNGRLLRVDTIPYKISQILFLGEGREVWARSSIEPEDGYIMNCFKQDELVAQYHPHHYENGATISFWESPFVLFEDGLYTHIMYNDTIYKYDFNYPKGGLVIKLGHAIPKELIALPMQSREDEIFKYLRKNKKVAHSPYLYISDETKVGVSYQYDGYNCFYIYDRLNGESCSFRGPHIGKVHIVDILYGTIACGDYFYYILDPSKYQDLETKKKSEIQSFYPELFNTLERASIDDNPILMVAKLNKKIFRNE